MTEPVKAPLGEFSRLPLFHDYLQAYNTLTPRQQQWVCDKSHQEALGKWSVMQQWEVPLDKDLLAGKYGEGYR